MTNLCVSTKCLLHVGFYTENSSIHWHVWAYVRAYVPSILLVSLHIWCLALRRVGPGCWLRFQVSASQGELACALSSLAVGGRRSLDTANTPSPVPYACIVTWPLRSLARRSFFTIGLRIQVLSVDERLQHQLTSAPPFPACPLRPA